MNKLNKGLFDQLIAEKKFTEAKELLRQFFSEEISEVDEGEYYVNLMTEYLEMSNVINRAYIEEMQDIKQNLEVLSEAKQKFHKDFDIDQVRKDISEM